MNAVEQRVENCVWCGRRLDSAAVSLGGRTRCAHCGAATTDPWPSEEVLRHAYGTWYRPQDGRFGPVGDRVLDRTRGLLASRIDRIAPAGPVLDVGAGDGVLVAALKRRGREAVGLERESRSSDVRDEPLERVHGDWAAVVFWHSLEHLPEPARAIEEAARLLVPGGSLVIAVPNSGSLQAEAFGDRWLHLDLPLHLVHLTQGALAGRLEELGFVIERASRFRGGQLVIGWLDGLVGRVTGTSLYQSLRRPEARSSPVPASKRALALGAAVALLPVAVGAAAFESARGRPGTCYLEARLGRA